MSGGFDSQRRFSGNFAASVADSVQELDFDIGNIQDDATFDASQYAFFCQGAREEIELGGLVDREDDGVEDDYNFTPAGDINEIEALDSISENDDLASTFAKLNRFVTEPSAAGVIGDRRSISRGSSSTADWSPEADCLNWNSQQLLDADEFQNGKRWWSQPHTSSHCLAELKPLYRTSSSPHQQHFKEVPIVPGLVSSSSFTYIPSTDQRSQPSQNPTRHSSIPSFSVGLQVPASNLPSLSSSQHHLGGIPHGLHNNAGYSSLSPGISLSSSSRDYLLNQTRLLSGEHLRHQQLPLSHGLYASQLFTQQQQQQRSHSLQTYAAPFSPLQSYSLSPHGSAHHFWNKFDMIKNASSVKDQISKPSRKGKQGIKFSQQSTETGSLKSEECRLQFRSKYMSSEEIENILKMQHASGHSTYPYVDDYYHQACLAKKSAISGVTNQFAPTAVKDLPSRLRVSHDHVYQIDALGKVPLSSIRRPRALLEADSESGSDNCTHDEKLTIKPLQKESMLAARVAIEDSFGLLLDIDDVDRLLEVDPQQDGGLQLQRRRQLILEVLAASLQLVDPFGPPRKPGHSSVLSQKDDIVFIRIVSLPKGQKLLSRYLKLLIPGSELTRVVCMAIFRHLRFIFGGLPSDLDAAETIVNLAKSVSLCVCSMELRALSGCLTAVVCASEQPPLRPLGNSSGDGASIIIKSVLDRATVLLTDPQTSLMYTVSNRTLWQASFDAFFGLLTQYCLCKYESITHSMVLQKSHASLVGMETTRAIISREMPLELLRASLPHTNEHQRKKLLDFVKKFMPVVGFSAHGGIESP